MSRIVSLPGARYILLAIFTAMPMLVLASSSGPPKGYTGAPGESTCRGCHADFALNSGPGTFSINAPASYDAGDTVSVTVNLSQLQQQRWGFSLTVLNSASEPVGEFHITDPVRTQTDTSNSGRYYVMHTSDGTDFGTPNASPGWTFGWVAPITLAGHVTFWGAGNAANADNNVTFDYIYTASATMEAGCQVALTGDINLSASLTSSDIIYLVGYVFKSGELPMPCEGAGDVNCDSQVSASDIIYLVNYVFKSADPPCDVCQLIPKSWPCQ